MYLTCEARLQLRLGLICEARSRVLMMHVSPSVTPWLRFDDTPFLLYLSCFLGAAPRFLVPYLFSGSSSSSAAHEGPDSGNSSSPKTKRLKVSPRLFCTRNLSNTHSQTNVVVALYWRARGRYLQAEERKKK